MMNAQFMLTCNVCKHAGKPYEGHAVRDKQGQVVCPTLLSQKCNYCKKKGHTPKYCPLKKKQQKQDDYKENERKETIKPKNTHSNIYDALESVGDECIVPQKIEKFKSNVNSWKDIVNRPPVNTKEIVKSKEIVKPKVIITVKKPRPALWSEYESDVEYED
jgi:hypothetical protein